MKNKLLPTFLHGSSHSNVLRKTSYSLRRIGIALVLCFVIGSCGDKSSKSAKRELTGEIFVSSTTGRSIKLGGVYVYIIPKDKLAKFIDKVLKVADRYIENARLKELHEKFWKNRMATLKQDVMRSMATADRSGKISLQSIVEKIDYSMETNIIRVGFRNSNEMGTTVMEALSDWVAVSSEVQYPDNYDIAKTNADGQFVIDLDPGTYWIYAVKEFRVCWLEEAHVFQKASKISLDSTNLFTEWDDKKLLGMCSASSLASHLDTMSKWSASLGEIPQTDPTPKADDYNFDLPKSFRELEDAYLAIIRLKLPAASAPLSPSLLPPSSTLSPSPLPPSPLTSSPLTPSRLPPSFMTSSGLKVDQKEHIKHNRNASIGVTIDVLETKTGKRYEKAVIKRFDDNGIYFSFPDGGVHLLWKDLPNSYSERFRN